MIAIVVAAGLLAFANGANDNFKGVATLVGGGTFGRKRALAWATVTTLAGSLAALWLGARLLEGFSGKGLIDPAVAASPRFIGAVAAGAGATVILATRIGMPTSTTHGLIGALIGAGIASASPVQWSVLGTKFVTPLLVSPVLALMGSLVLYPLLRFGRERLRVSRGSAVHVAGPGDLIPANMAIGAGENSPAETGGKAVTMEAGRTLDVLHILSAGAMGFARGVNDTPKVAALLLVLPAFTGEGAILFTGFLIAVGGLLASRRVGRTMSHDITPMNEGQGFTSNLVTTALVLTASPLGLPVSTTHVSNGALFGIGLVRGDANRRTIGRILTTWLLTLPVAALLAASVFLLG